MSTDSAGNSPLINAARDGDIEALKKLIADGVDLNAQNTHGDTAAITAIMWGKPEALQLLAEAGADLNLWNKDGRTTAHWAARKENPEYMKILVAHHASLDSIATWRQEAPIDMAITEDNAATLKVMIDAHVGLDRLPVIKAVRHNSLKSLKVLIDAKADLNEVTAKGETGLYVAADCGHDVAFKMLIDAGANHTIVSEWNAAAASIAAQRGKAGILRLAMEKGTDLDPEAKMPSELGMADLRGHTTEELLNDLFITEHHDTQRALHQLTTTSITVPDELKGISQPTPGEKTIIERLQDYVGPNYHRPRSHHIEHAVNKYLAKLTAA